MSEQNQFLEVQNNNLSVFKNRFFTRSLPIALLISVIINFGFIASLMMNRDSNSRSATGEERINYQAGVLSDDNTKLAVSPTITGATPLVSQAISPVMDLAQDRIDLTNYLKKYYFGRRFANFVPEVAQKLTINDVMVKIDRMVPNYAAGTYNYILPEGGGGSVWFATKLDGEWSVIETTQEPPSCRLMTQFKFPKEIYQGCIEK